MIVQFPVAKARTRHCAYPVTAPAEIIILPIVRVERPTSDHAARERRMARKLRNSGKAK